MISPAQCRAARELVGWTQEHLAENAGVSLSALRNFEQGKTRPVAQNMNAIVRALSGAGLEFIEEDEKGEGVRFSKPPRERV